MKKKRYLGLFQGVGTTGDTLNFVRRDGPAVDNLDKNIPLAEAFHKPELANFGLDKLMFKRQQFDGFSGRPKRIRRLSLSHWNQNSGNPVHQIRWTKATNKGATLIPLQKEGTMARSVR